MKLNIAYPATGAQKLIDIEDELKVRFLYDRRMASEVEMDPLGDEWKGYVCRISGGNDKQGFPMKQGVLTAGRVRLLMSKGTSCYRPRRTGERKRKSVHGCIVDASLSVLNLVITKKGDAEMPGLTDKTVPRRLGPKRASNIRKLFNLTKTDDVRQYVVRRPLKEKEGKPQRTKAPKIQRLITPRRLQRKRFRVALKKKRAEKSKGEAADYAKLVLQRAREEKERKDEAKRRRSSASKGSDHGKTTPTQSISQQPTVKKSGKVAAQAPEVAQILAGKKGQPSGLETVGMKQGPVAPGTSKQKAQSGAGKDAKSRTQAGVGAGGGQKVGAPGRSVKDPQTKKAADLATATEKKVGGPKPPAGQQPPKKK